MNVVHAEEIKEIEEMWKNKVLIYKFYCLAEWSL